MGISRHPLSSPPPAWAAVPVDRSAAPRLRESFALLAAEGPRVAALFYQRLFDRYPGVRPLFPTDMRAQEARLLESLRVVVAHLEDPASVRAQLKELGARHVRYGARPEHYPLVCAVLLESMAEAAGAAWNPQLAAEWAQALHIVSSIMLEGAAEVPAAPH